MRGEASAEQSRGGAGRVRSGLCLRLYTQSRWKALPLEHPPEFAEFATHRWNRDLRIDQAFQSHDGVEWLVEGSDAAVIMAVWVRCFGPDFCEYGSLNAEVKSKWVEIRQGLDTTGFAGAASRLVHGGN